MVSRLPITARPAHREITVSYLARLAALNEMPAGELWRQVTRNRKLDDDILAILSRQPRARLERAIIELLTPQPDWRMLRHEPQRGCRRCTAAHPGGPVLQLLDHQDYVCTRHQIWIGPPDLLDHPQPDISDLPELVIAQRRHRRLLRHIGPAATFDALLTGFLICAHRWNYTEISNDRDALADWHRRADTLIPPGTEHETFSTSRLFAATYPEAVLLAELIGSLHWRRLAAGGPDDQARFVTEVSERLSLHNYRPAVLKDPISHWIEADCWNPPSPPNFTFNTLRTFRGPSGFRRSANNADTKRGTSALWFSRHRRGGDAMLHHRTLNPVVIRDWSPKMEMFTSALALTADTSRESHEALNLDRPRTTTEFRAYTEAHWFRPHPQPSTWLDEATEPLPWDDRSGGRRPTTGGRPLLPGEKRLYAKFPIRSNPLRSSHRFDD